MTAISYTEAARDFQTVLKIALNDDVFINRRADDFFESERIVTSRKTSLLDIDGITTKVTTQDILDALHDNRAASRV